MKIASIVTTPRKGGWQFVVKYETHKVVYEGFDTAREAAEMAARWAKKAESESPSQEESDA